MDAQLNDMIRLKQPPSAPIERWQMIPTRPKATTRGPKPTSTACQDSPLRPRPQNFTNQPQTPGSSKFVIKYKRSPKIGRCTPSKTPGNQFKSPHGLSKKRAPPTSAKKTPGRSGHTPSGCRFIPNRSTMDMEYSSYLLQQKKGAKDTEESPSREEYRQALMKALSKSRGKKQKGVLSFSQATPSMDGSLLNYTDNWNSTNTSAAQSSHKKKSRQKLPLVSERILDAPLISDDYYLNTLDWGKNNNIAIGLGGCVYLWDATNGTVRELMELSSENDYVSSVSWAGNGKYLAIGSSTATIQLWDVEKERKVRTMQGHTDRVGVLTWNSHTLTSGSRDGSIHHHDVRKADHCIAKSQYHQLEVCGLKWSPDGKLLASGANDNLVCIWKLGDHQEPSQVLQGHQAAVKAVSWCPWKPNILASGGGTSDRCVRFWNAATGQCINSVDTGSQVSAIAWNREHREIITSHGLPKNQISVWKYPSMTKVGDLMGHSKRILHMRLSPKKTSIASASADETLRIWKCFEKSQSDESRSQSRLEDSITSLLHSSR